MASRDPLRLDRFLTVGVTGPVLRRARKPALRGVPVLMYHSISQDLEIGRAPYYQTVTRPHVFEEQIRFLAAQGYQFVTLSEAVATLRRDVSGADDARRVVITFDDGYRDFHEHAHRVLQEVGARSTVFLATDYVGRRFPNGRECLAPEEVRALTSLGVEFGSHTATHPHLYALKWREVDDELRRSKERVEDLVGAPCNLFSYPFRFPEEDRKFTQRLRELLQEVGYEIGVTTAIGCARSEREVLYLPRLPVNDFDDAAFLAAKLEGAYDWLHAVQFGFKWARSVVRRRRRSEGDS